ncbi:MAG: hypothetical protein ACPG8W_08965 [Candidatus Promineifilaceae bacterium]
MIRPVYTPLVTLFEIGNVQATRTKRPVSTLAFDWLYVMLSLLLTIGILMDVWSHIEFGPDQSIFNEYHLLFYGSMTAIMVLLGGLLLNNLRDGYPLAMALPQGYGLGFLAVLLFGLSGVIDLSGHAMFGFESDIEALTSPTHLLLFINWFLILFAPVQAARARAHATGQFATLRQSLPKLLAYGCMMACINIPLMNFFPMGSSPYMLQEMRPASDYYGLSLGISGTLLQTMITVAFILWLVREFRMPRGGFTVAFGFYGLFVTILEPAQLPILMFGGLGILLDVTYQWLKPDATRRAQFVLFSLLASAFMWLMAYGVMALLGGGMNAFYYSGYNLYGSVAQAVTLGSLVGYLMSMPAPRAIALNTAEAPHA